MSFKFWGVVMKRFLGIRSFAPAPVTKETDNVTSEAQWIFCAILRDLGLFSGR